MDLIHYSFAPLVLFRVPYVLDIHFNVLLYWNFVCSVTQRVGFVHKFIYRKPAVMRKNDQGLTNLYGSVVFHIQHPLV